MRAVAKRFPSKSTITTTTLHVRIKQNTSWRQRTCSLTCNLSWSILKQICYVTPGCSGSLRQPFFWPSDLSRAACWSVRSGCLQLAICLSLPPFFVSLSCGVWMLAPLFDFWESRPELCVRSPLSPFSFRVVFLLATPCSPRRRLAI